MTDDELHTLWLRGVSVEAIARHASRSRTSIRSRISRLRIKEGEDRWPLRQTAQREGNEARRKGYVRKRAGPSTLPPLPSLS